jgi:hypothetical protein
VLLDLELLADRASVHSLRSFHAIVAFKTLSVHFICKLYSIVGS